MGESSVQILPCVGERGFVHRLRFSRANAQQTLSAALWFRQGASQAAWFLKAMLWIARRVSAWLARDETCRSSWVNGPSHSNAYMTGPGLDELMYLFESLQEVSRTWTKRWSMQLSCVQIGYCQGAEGRTVSLATCPSHGGRTTWNRASNRCLK